MAEPSESALDPADIRWKMAVACDLCRKRKVRCDGERPCSRCAKSSITCTFSLPKHVSRKTDAPTKKRRSNSGASSQPEAKRRVLAGEPNSSSSKRAAASPSGSSDPEASEKDKDKQQLLLIDPDDQIVYSGPSSGMPLFARLGLLRTVEVVEGDNTRPGGGGAGEFSSHSSGALGLTSALTNTRDYFDMCLVKCPQDRMLLLLGHHLHSPVFFPLLHAPSLLAEFVAVAEGRLRCTAPYAALLMSILAVTAKLVDSVKPLLPEADRGGEQYYEFAQDLLRVSANKLDVRHILALYHLSVYAEGRTSAAGDTSSFVTEAIGLAFTTGLHRSTREFNMDPVTLQIRTRLFWALYSMDIAIAYSQGRPALIPLQECSIEFPAMVENSRITKAEILPQPEDEPAVSMCAAITILEIYMILEQVLSSINAPSKTIAQKYSLDSTLPRRTSRLKRAVVRLDEIEESLPDYLHYPDPPEDRTKNMNFIMWCRIRCTLLFARTLIARQFLIDEFEAAAPTAPARGSTSASASNSDTTPSGASKPPPPPTPTPAPSEATLRACRLSLDIVSTCYTLYRLGFLQHCSFTTVSHLLAAGHTLIACMARSAILGQQHRADLMTCVEMLANMEGRFPCAGPAAKLLQQLARTMDIAVGGLGGGHSEALAIRVLARKMAKSPSSTGNRPLPGTPSSHPSHRGSTTSTPTAPTPTPHAGSGSGPAPSNGGFFPPTPATAHPDLTQPPPLHPHPNAPATYDDEWLVRVTGLGRPVEISSEVRHARLNGQLDWPPPHVQQQIKGPAVKTERVDDETYGEKPAPGPSTGVRVDRGNGEEIRRQKEEYEAGVRAYKTQQIKEAEDRRLREEKERQIEREREAERERQNEKERARRAMVDAEAQARRIGREWGERGGKPHQQIHQPVHQHQQVPSLPPPPPPPHPGRRQSQVSPPFPTVPPPHHTPQQPQHHHLPPPPQVQQRLPPPHQLSAYPDPAPHPSRGHTPHTQHPHLPPPPPPPHHIPSQHNAYAHPPPHHQQYHQPEPHQPHGQHGQRHSISPVQPFTSVGSSSSSGRIPMGMPVDMGPNAGPGGSALGMNGMGGNPGPGGHPQQMAMSVDDGSYNMGAHGQVHPQVPAQGHGQGPSGLPPSLAGAPLLWQTPHGSAGSSNGNGNGMGLAMEMGGAGGLPPGLGMGAIAGPGFPMTQTPMMGALTGVGLASGSTEWDDNFSFLNDGLFGTL
ncbi:hypothetical protein IAT38_003805 [Cryptococcus sp. DSM 104549]